jgi:hypothetical protein
VASNNCLGLKGLVAVVVVVVVGTRSIVARVPVGNSQVLSSNPGGSEFCPGLKKNPHPSSFSKAQAKARPNCGNGALHWPDTHMSCGHELQRRLCKGGGVRGFSRST